ncbi:MAG: IS66 family insertion sequence element accessory protein TnpB, partial [Gammaproteobacteria bacterium]|nr:IS66 family insertion sequence element accessory protein TnpB [Gammaproteobacteria bacterium]
WRRLAREGRLGADEPTTFARAVIACDPASTGVAAMAISRSRIEVVLADGIRVVVEEAVDAGALARIVGALERR